MSDNFWENKKLQEFSTDEWESLCDGCGLCCLMRFEDEDTGEIVESNIACKYLDLETCKCTDYANRKTNVPTCWAITPENIDKIYWMPKTCAYRLINEGKDLYPWHHLVCGDKNEVHKQKISYIGEMVCEDDAEYEC